MEVKITEKTMNELDEFLQGNLIPKKFSLENLPTLTPEQAWTVIYMLQEWLLILPDSFEKCSECGIIYDTKIDGIYSGDSIEEIQEYIDAGFEFSKDDLQKHFCGNCAP